MQVPPIAGISKLPRQTVFHPTRADPPPPTNPPSLCTLCPSSPSNSSPTPKPTKYTCPRCQAKTCSLTCSKAHKLQIGCSGERNKAAYVSMKEYGWGTMMDDYTFLEGVGRKVSEVGREIVGGGFLHSGGSAFVGANGSSGEIGSMGARGRGRGGARGMRGGGERGRMAGGKTKRDIFKMQMEVRDIDVDLLPLGMKRRKVNQSSWDFKNQTASLTIEYKIHQPLDPLAPNPPSSPKPQPLTILIHRVKTDQPLLSILQSLIKDRSKKEVLRGKPTKSASSSSCPEWLQSLVLPSLEDPEGFAPPRCVMRAPTDPLLVLHYLKQETQEQKEYASGLGKTLADKLEAYSRRVSKPATNATTNTRTTTNTETTTTTVSNSKRKRNIGDLSFKFPKVYYDLDINQPFAQALRHTQFVEFPMIEVFEEGDERFKGAALVSPQNRGEYVYSMKDVAAANGSYNGSGRGPEPAVKRRKLDPKAGKERMKGLIGGYGSGSEASSNGADIEDVEETKKRSVVALVGDYAASDDEGGDPFAASMQEEEEAEKLDPAALLELVRQVKGEQWAKEQEGVDDEALDWESSDADAEGEPDYEDD